MLEIIYRIYQVANDEIKKIDLTSDIGFGLYSSTSKEHNIELLMDCMVCDNREQFKDIIRNTYGESISFRYSKKLKSGDLYCIIIGEHCYNTERYFNKIHFQCDQCGCDVETYYGKPICFKDYEIKHDLYGIDEYSNLRFCSVSCREQFKHREIKKLKPNDEQEF